MCPQGQSVLSGLLCNAIEATTTFVGSLAGFAVGGGGGALLTVAIGGVNLPAVPAEAYAGAAAGAGLGLAAGRAVTNVLFSENSGSSAGGSDPAAGLRRQLDAHQQKLEQYRANPDAFDNKGLLRNASPEVRQRIIQGRIRHLEGQIRNFQDQIRQLEGTP